MRYSFEDYVLDDAHHELRRGTEIVAIEARIFDLLAYLIRNRERVVSQEDLRLAIWDGRIVSVSTISSSMNSVRVAIGDNGEDQRLIRTVPRKGFRFVGSVAEELGGPAEPAAPPPTGSTAEVASPAAAEPPESNTSPGLPPALMQQPAVIREPAENSSDRPTSLVPPIGRTLRTSAIFAAGTGLGAVAATAVFLLWPLWGAPRNTPTNPSTRMFAASAVPILDDATRRDLETYSSRPDFKALAISDSGWYVTDRAPDIESAKRDALQGCAATKSQRGCTIYAAGMDVVLSEQTMPVPAPTDLRMEPMDISLVLRELPAVGPYREQIELQYPKQPAHKALAITTRGFSSVGGRGTGREAARIAVERCAYLNRRPCLVVAAGDFLTIQIPKSRNIARIFLPSTEIELSDGDKERIGRIYQGREWRALARGKNGSWHAIANEPSEAAAVEAALKTCAQASEGCRLYAIGNFRVAEE